MQVDRCHSTNEVPERATKVPLCRRTDGSVAGDLVIDTMYVESRSYAQFGMPMFDPLRIAHAWVASGGGIRICRLTHYDSRTLR